MLLIQRRRARLLAGQVIHNLGFLRLKLCTCLLEGRRLRCGLGLPLGALLNVSALLGGLRLQLSLELLKLGAFALQRRLGRRFGLLCGALLRGRLRRLRGLGLGGLELLRAPRLVLLVRTPRLGELLLQGGPLGYSSIGRVAGA